MAGCAERVVGVRGGLHGLPGAQSGYQDLTNQASIDTSVEAILSAYRPTDPNLVPIEDEPLRFLNEEGDLVIEARSPQHVIYHVAEMLERGEDDLLFEWIISARAKSRYRASFIDPRETVRFLHENRNDVIQLFLLMPSGEVTPGVRMTTPETNVVRLRPDLGERYTRTRTKFTTVEFSIEHGRCTLLTIY